MEDRNKMPGPNQQRRRRASGVLAEAIRKDLERDANGGAEPDAPKRRERRTSAAFRRASFQAGPVPLRSEEMQQQQRQQGQSRRGSSTNMARRASSSNLARRGSSSALHAKGGTSSSRRTSISKKISPNVIDKKPATKTSPYPSQRAQQPPSGDTSDEDDDDALIMACIANMESRSKPGYRPTPAPPTSASEPRSKHSTTSTNAEQKQKGAIDAFLESQKQERAALAYFQAQQAEQAAISQAMQQGGEKIKQISPQPSLTSTKTAPREEKPISSELARHRARIKAAQEREDNAFTGMSLEQHKARIANQYGDCNKGKSTKKTGEGDIKSSKDKNSSQSQGRSSQKKKDRQTDASFPRTASSGAPSSSIPRANNDKCEEPTKSKQPKAKRRELEGSLRKLENLPTESSSTAPSTNDSHRKRLTACDESVSSSSRRGVILAASQSIRSQGYDELGESHRSLRSLDNGLLEKGVDLESEKQRAIQAVPDKMGDDEIDDSSPSPLSTNSPASSQCHHQKPKRSIERKQEKRQASPPRSHSGTPPPSQDLRKFDRGEHFLSSDDPILFFEGMLPSLQKGTQPGGGRKDSKLILDRPSKRPGTSSKAIEFVDEPVAIVKIPHLHDMTSDEKLAMWFSQAEHRQMRKKILKDVYALHREDTERVTCSRGLEYATSEAEWRHRKTNKQNALSSVLEEQSRQKKFDDHDAAELATVSTIHSQVSQFYARERGEEDERYVDQNVRDGNNKSKPDATNHDDLGQSNSSLQEVPAVPGFLPNFFASFTKGLSTEEVQTGRDSANHSSHLICDFGERARRASGHSITDGDKRVVGSKAA